MAYLTFDKISSTILLRKADSVNASISARTYSEKKVFLSYRRNDKKYVEGIVRFFKSLGIPVYVDYLDETLEDKTNEGVAAILREHIKASAKFISLATPDSSNSKWMPWELGLGDRIINYENVAILPLTSSSSVWSDQEYAKIYGRIEGTYFTSTNSPDDWFVIYPNSQKVKLKDWLTK